MAKTKLELETKLSDLEEALPIETDATIKAALEKAIANTKTELASLPDEEESDDKFIQSMLSTIAATMKSSEGGADTPEIREIIKNYLIKDKVKLSELDQSVLDEIKKNQTIILEIPNFAKQIVVSSQTASIPNFYQIIDDILAGNNVYLIGEAGGGKTYTAKEVSKAIGREYVTLNCSQYTSPLEILGGQSVEGFKTGKLVDCWKNGKILIIDEMPKLDPNTAGLFNDALAQSTKTTKKQDAKINSADAEEPPIERNNDFAIIATGNIYPNEPPAPQYRGNNQQDLSLLDRFSGSVYYTEFDPNTDQRTTRFQFLYDFLIGNYYTYIKAKKEGTALPTPTGLRTIIQANNLQNMALVSYRTNISFRVAFEYELVRAIAKKQGIPVVQQGKTLAKTFDSYMVAFRSNPDTVKLIYDKTKYVETYINNLVEDNIKKILSGEKGFLNSLNEILRNDAKGVFERYSDFYIGDVKIEK